MGYRCRWQGIGRSYKSPKSEVLESQKNIINIFTNKCIRDRPIVFDLFVEGIFVGNIAKLMAHDIVWLKGMNKKDGTYSSKSESAFDHFLDKPLISLYELMNEDKEKYCANCSHKIVNNKFIAVDLDKYVHCDCIEEWKIDL